MSKASNQSKQLKRRRTRSRTKPSQSAGSGPIRKDRNQTRSRRRRSGWVKKRNQSGQQTRTEKLAQASGREAVATKPSKPLVRGDLQRVLTKSGGRSNISEISREATAGGVIYRLSDNNELEILLVADHFNRWTIPKGHIEEGETAQETAIREIGEEAGVHQLDPICWLGKIHFRYRRENILVLMSTQIYLFKALGDTNDIQKEDWMKGIKWFSYDEAVNIIAYKDIAKLIRLGRRRLEQKGEIDGQE